MPDTQNTPPQADELASLRAEIDTLDNSLHDLLMRRAEVVSRLAQSRAKGATIPLRPGREARILRRLLARHAGPLPGGAIIRLWREIFASSSALQGKLTVAAYVSGPGTALARLAREHFGTATQIRNHPSSARALATVTSGEAALAVLPMPEESESPETAWWVSLDAPRLQVIARLPFFGPAQPAALVVAPIAPDASGEDRSLLRVEAPEEMNRARLHAALDAAGLTPRTLLLRRSGDVVQALADMDGFVTSDDPRLAAVKGVRVVTLGAYAVPMSGE